MLYSKKQFKLDSKKKEIVQMHDFFSSGQIHFYQYQNLFYKIASCIF